MHIDEIIEKIDSAIPSRFSMEGDKTGLQVEPAQVNIGLIMICLEVTDEVIDEALDAGAGLIISFHPLIYRPLQAITSGERVGRLAARLVRHGIGLFVCHTNFDCHPQGSNMAFCRRIGAEPFSYLQPHPLDESFGMGMIAKLPKEMPLDEFAGLLSERLFSPVRYTEGKSGKISTIAVICGSGSSFIPLAELSGADAFVTADLGYHAFHAAKGRMGLIEAGHYEMEQFVPAAIKSLLKETYGEGFGSMLRLSAIRTNPLSYADKIENPEKEQINYLTN